MSKPISKSEDAKALAKEKRKQELASKYKSTNGGNNIKPDDSQIKYTQGKEVVLLPLDKLVNSKDNMFNAWSEEEMLINKISINENGLFSPIIIKDNGDGTYTILAGHNRTEAYRQLKEEAIELGLNDKVQEFSTIPAFIYPEDTTADKCLEIMVDTNLRSRQKMSKEAEIKAINASMKIMKKQKSLSGKNLMDILEENNVRKSVAYEAQKICNDLIEDFANVYYSGKIMKKAVVAIASLDRELQQYLYDTYGDSVTSKNAILIKKNMAKEDLDSLFFSSEEEKESKTISKMLKIEIPKDKEKFFNEWYAKIDLEAEFEKFVAKKEQKSIKK